MDDKRSEQRRRALMPGKFLLSGGGAIDCVLRDRSPSGARLRVVSVIGIPDEFTLQVETTGETRTARVAWRKQNEVGVKLVAA